MIVPGVYSTLLDKFFQSPEEACAAEVVEKSNLAEDLKFAENQLENVRNCYNDSKTALRAEYEVKLEALRKEYEPAIEALIQGIQVICRKLND